MRRSVRAPEENRAGDCDTYRLGYKTMADFERVAKPQIQPFLNAISGKTGDEMMRLKDSRDGNENVQYLTLLSQLSSVEANLSSHIRCIQKDILQRNDISSRLYTLQQEVEEARKTAAQRKETLAEAKERSSEIQNPYNNTTWWESWFPLGRPIRKENVPVLLSVSILMLVFSLGIFLRFAGLELQLASLASTTNSFITKVNSSKYPQKG